MNGEELNSEEDFNWYKARLDVEQRYQHRHWNEPERYPCLVRSDWWDDPNGPYTFRHYLTYQKEVVTTCTSCGHVEKKKEWDYEHA